MGNLTFLYPEQVTNETLGFFSLGDKEVQTKLAEIGRTLTLEELILYLKYTSLLYDRVLHSASFPFESELSLSLYTDKQILPLFLDRHNMLVVSSDIESLSDHLEKKRQVTPKTFLAYHSSNANKVIARLRGLDSAYKRNTEIGKIIAASWKNDLANLQISGSLINLVRSIRDRDKALQFERTLNSIVDNREEFQISQAYVSQALTEQRFPRQITRSVMDRLLAFYIESSAKSMNARPIDITEFIEQRWLTAPIITRYNIALFAEFADGLGMKAAIYRLPSKELGRLKSSDEYREFLRRYFEIVDETASLEENLFKLNMAVAVEQDIKTYLKFKNYITIAAGALLVIVFQKAIQQLPILSVPLALAPSILDDIFRKICKFNSTPFLVFKERILRDYSVQRTNLIS